MTQNPASPTLSRTAPHPATVAAGDDLDALLDSIMGDDPGPRQERVAPAAREGIRQHLEQQHAEEQRARRTEIVTDELRSQVRSLALQVQSISEATETQVAQGRAIQELRQAVREIVVATHRQPKPLPIFNAELQLPSLQIKLVLAQAANLLHQADKDVTVLGNWSRLFAGVALGTSLSIAFSIFGPYTTRFWIYLAITAFACLVSMVFALLAYRARRRVVEARRAMEESTLTRSIPIGS